MEIKTTITNFIRGTKEKPTTMDVQMTIIKFELDSKMLSAISSELTKVMAVKLLPEVSKKIFLDEEFMEKIKEDISFMVAKRSLDMRLADDTYNNFGKQVHY